MAKGTVKTAGKTKRPATGSAAGQVVKRASKGPLASPKATAPAKVRPATRPAAGEVSTPVAPAGDEARYYVAETDKAYFLGKLRIAEAEQSAIIEVHTPKVRTPLPGEGDPDRAAEVTSKMESAQTAERARLLLGRIRSAISRINGDDINGEDFGRCRETGNLIPFGRLDSLPWVTTTVEGQEQIERNARIHANGAPGLKGQRM